MKIFWVALVGIALVGCTTVNVYPESEPIIIIQKNDVRDPSNPYGRKRNY